MSLVICSNDTTEQAQTAGRDGSIFKPWSFRNDMSSTMTLPADCQVALQSAKIHMDGRISLGDLSSRTFYWWFGKCPASSMGPASNYNAIDASETTSQAVKVVLFATEEGRVETDINGLKIELQKCLNRACFHPNLHNRIEVVTVYDTASGIFTGYEFQFKEEIATVEFQPTNRIPYNDTSMVLDALIGAQRRYQAFGVAGPGRLAPTYAVTRNLAAGPVPDNIKFTMNAAVEVETQSIVLNVPPLNLKGTSATSVARGGQAAFNFEGSDPSGGVNPCRFACGLSRPTLEIEDPGGEMDGYIFPSWYKHGNGREQPRWCNYYDFALVCNMMEDEPGAAGSKNYLRLFHSVVNSTDQGGHADSASPEWQATPKLQAFKYGSGATGHDTGCVAAVTGSADWSNDYGYNFDTNALNITGVLFVCSGQQVLVQLYDKTLSDGTHTKYTIAAYNAAHLKRNNLKPIDQGCWSLLPQVTINNDGSGGGGQSIFFERFDGVDNLYTEARGGTWDLLSYGGAFEGGMRNPTGARGEPGINEGRSSWELVNSTLTRTNQLVREINSRNMLNYNFLPAAAGTYVYDTVAATPVFNFERQKQVLILEEQPRVNYPHTEGALATQLLGFENRAVVDFSALNAGHEFIVQSVTHPPQIPTSSIFVRLHGFNQQSTNAKARGKSDIIAHLPRFDGSQSIGALYLEPNSLMYLDLNNPNEIKVNSFDISLCYSNEQYAENLVGTTIICLHFRPKPK